MSFSSTPIGQGRRLDQHTFLNRPPPHNKPNSSSSSFSYGSSTSANRSPGGTSTLSRTRSQNAIEALGDEQDEPALVRYARLKQRNQTLSGTRASGPGIITSPPKPHQWSVRDTTVNVATAFYQAAESIMPTQTPNGAWATGARIQPVPRSTSVEYENEKSAASTSRRLAPPPGRGGPTRVRPLAKTQSMRSVPDSEAEEEVNRSMRAKSPFDQVAEYAKRGLQAATYYVRQRSQEPEGANGSSYHDADASTSRTTANDSNSYDYAVEEASFRSAVGKPLSASKRAVNTASANHRKNRMSVDNKAYRPSASDLDDSDEDLDGDDGKKRKKKKKKGEAAGGPLTSLPVVGPERRRKGTKKTKTRQEEGEGEEQAEEEEHSGSEDRASQQQRALEFQPPLLRTSVPPPPSRHTSMPRGASKPPADQEDMMDTSGDVPDGSLDPIQEEEELPADPDVENSRREALVPRHRGSRLSGKSGFSLGGTLGTLVNSLARFFGFVSRISLQTLAAIFQFTIYRPLRWLVHQGSALGQFLVYAAVGVLIVGVLWQLWAPLVGLLPSLSRPAVYQPPAVPAADIAELAARLQSVENVLSGLAMDSERTRSQRDLDGKAHKDVTSRLAELETRVKKEVARAQEVEVQHLASSSASIQVLRSEMATIAEQLQKIPVHDGESHTVVVDDQETRAKLLELEARLGGVEGGVKEALDLGKHSVKTGSTTGEHWWNKIGSGSSALTIKSSDGQDVTSLIGQLVDSAVSLIHKDVIARPDFALYSAGARIIPSLTSETVTIKPKGVRAKLLGYLTNEGHGMGRPPVVAIHPDTHSGNCWPFSGTTGQLGVALASPVYITDVTIDHVAKEIALDARSAPRQMELWGLIEGKDNVRKYEAWLEDKRVRRDREIQDAVDMGLPAPSFQDDDHPPTLSKSYMKITNFTYNVHGSNNIQTFPVPQEVRDLGIDFGVVVLMVKNNWGMDSFTCIYRLRVHGQRMGEIPLPYPEDPSL